MGNNTIKKIFNTVFEGSAFRKNLLVLTSGTVIAQCIPVLFSPLLTRLFTPADFGLFNNFIVISGFLGILISGKYELAIVLPKKDRYAINLLSLSCLLALLFTIIFILMSILFSVPIAALLKMHEIQGMIWLIPCSAFLSIIYMTFNEWCIRESKFKTLSKNKITNTGGISGFSFIFGAMKIQTGLVLGQVIGQVISSITAVLRVLKEDKYLFKYVTIFKMKFLARKYSDFVKYYVTGQVISSAGGLFPALAITYKFGLYEAGLFALTDRVLGVPLVFIGNAVKDVFKQRATEDFQKTGNCLSIYKKTTIALLKFSVVPFVLLFFLAPSLFSIVFGSNWHVAGEYARYLTIMFIINFISMPTSSMFIVAERQKLHFIWQIISLICSVVPVLLGVTLASMRITVIAWGIGKGTAYLILMLFSYKLAKGRQRIS